MGLNLVGLLITLNVNNQPSVANEIQRMKNKSKRLEREGENILKYAREKNDYLNAKEKFNEAWKICNGEESLLSKINKTEFWIFIKQGDEYFNSSDYYNASIEYNRAVILAQNMNFFDLQKMSKMYLEKSRKEIEREEKEKYEKMYNEKLEKEKLEAEKNKKEQLRLQEELRKEEELNKKRLFEQQKRFERIKRYEKIERRKRKRNYGKKRKRKKIEKANLELQKKSNELILNEKEIMEIKLINNKFYINKIKNYIELNKNIMKVEKFQFNQNNINIIIK